MSGCLNEAELQAVVDNEAPDAHQAHVAQCAACSEKVAVKRRLTERVGAAAASVELPEAVRTQMRTRIVDAPAAGATTLRAVSKTPRWVWAIPAAAVAMLLMYLVVVPGIDRRTTVSAAEILGRSQAALAAPITGLEFLSYDLEVGGALGDLLPEEQAGRFEIQELIDHDHEGRYRVVKLASDGRIVGGAADDTLNGTRVRYLRANGRGFLLRFDGAAPTALSIVALKKGAMQLFIGLMQSSGNQTMREIDRAGEHCYEISIPGMTMPAASIVSLDRARAVITASDSRLVEFSAAGTFSGQPFTVDFALRFRAWGNATIVPNPDFDLKPEPGDVVLQGDATANPLWDVLTRVLDAVPASAAQRH
jgi:hypothetical protein